MKIEIKKLEVRDGCGTYLTESYQVRIAERLSESDIFHTVERITTSPTFVTEINAQNWLIKYLSR